MMKRRKRGRGWGARLSPFTVSQGADVHVFSAGRREIKACPQKENKKEQSCQAGRDRTSASPKTSSSASTRLSTSVGTAPRACVRACALLATIADGHALGFPCGNFNPVCVLRTMTRVEAHLRSAASMLFSFLCRDRSASSIGRPRSARSIGQVNRVSVGHWQIRFASDVVRVGKPSCPHLVCHPSHSAFVHTRQLLRVARVGRPPSVFVGDCQLCRRFRLPSRSASVFGPSNRGARV